jgi:hypothetical protein
MSQLKRAVILALDQHAVDFFQTQNSFESFPSPSTARSHDLFDDWMPGRAEQLLLNVCQGATLFGPYFVGILGRRERGNCKM